LIIANSKSNLLGAQGTFRSGGNPNYSFFSQVATREPASDAQLVAATHKENAFSLTRRCYIYIYIYIYICIERERECILQRFAFILQINSAATQKPANDARLIALGRNMHRGNVFLLTRMYYIDIYREGILANTTRVGLGLGVSPGGNPNYSVFFSQAATARSVFV